MKKVKKMHIKLHENEALVVATAEDFYRIAQTFDVLATVDDYTDYQKASWREAAVRFRNWTKATVNAADEDAS